MVQDKSNWLPKSLILKILKTWRRISSSVLSKRSFGSRVIKSRDGIHGNGSRRPYRLDETRRDVNSITAADVGRAEPSKAQETSPVLPGLADRRLTGCEEEIDSERWCSTLCIPGSWKIEPLELKKKKKGINWLTRIQLLCRFLVLQVEETLFWYGLSSRAVLSNILMSLQGNVCRRKTQGWTLISGPAPPWISSTDL